MVHADGPGGLDGVAVCFDDQRAVADAGIVLAATLAKRLGIEALVDESVCLGERPGAANAGAKVMTLVSAMALGADCIDDCEILRAGRTGQVLGHQVAAPSTLGTFLRAFTFGHVRQLDRVLADTLAQDHALLDERLDPQSLRERRRQDDPGVRDRPLIVKTDRDAVQSDRPVNMHHEGDLLSQAATAAIGRFSHAQEVILRSRPDGTTHPAGGSRLS